MRMRYPQLCLWLLLSWSASIGVLRAAGPTVQIISTSEVSALHALYLATNGSFWTWAPPYQGIWNFSEPNPQPCVEEWQGIGCGDCASGLCHVTTLNLQSFNMSGTLPMGLVNLTHLSVLDLRRNFISGTLPILENMSLLSNLDLRSNLLTGTLPAWLGNMASLTHLNLSVNGFWGGFPDELFNSSHLSVISIASNRLNGTLPKSIARLQSLTELDVGVNLLTGTIVEELGSLPSLQYLRLGVNELEGSIPAALFNATSLVWIYLDNNTLTGSLSSQVMNLVSLRTLDLHSNYLVGSIPTDIGNLPNLTYLSLYWNMMTGEIPPSFGADSHLEHIYLYRNLFSGTLPKSIAQMRGLELMDVHMNYDLRGTINETFQGMSFISYLVLAQNHFTGPIAQLNCTRMLSFRVEENFLSGSLPESLSTPYLSYLNFSVNIISGQLPAGMVQECPHVNWDASVNALSGSIPDVFEKGCTMIQLFLNDNQLSGSLPPSLSNLVELAELDLSTNHLSGILPNSLQKLRSLEILFLANNYLSGPLDDLLNSTSQQFVTNVDVSHNRFTGSIPLEPFRINSLWSFAASSNCLHGNIPSQICEAAGLVVLVMDGMSTSEICRRNIFPSLPYLNAFVLRYSLGGTIPECIFSMSTLRSLHLSGNDLTGSLPDTEDYSPVLSDINLSHNQIGGPIPLVLQRRPLRTLDLSYNRFGSSLDADFAPGSNRTSLSLQVNRLSGTIPDSLRAAPNISILDGNIFECSISREELPRNDPQHAIYVCGSDAVNTSLFAWTALWLLALVIATAGVGGYLWRHRQSPFHFYYTCYEQWVHMRAALLSLESCAASNADDDEIDETDGSEDAASHLSVMRVDPRAVEKLMALFRSIRMLFVWTGAFIFLVFVPVFLGMTSMSATYTYEYAWKLSGVLLGGSTAAVVLVVLFDGIILVFVYHMVRMWLRHPPRRVGAGETGWRASSVREALRVSMLALLNLFVMIAVDCGYVYMVFHYDSLAIGLTQVAMALFKIFWNEKALWMLIPWTKVRFRWLGDSDGDDIARSSSERGSRAVDIELSPSTVRSSVGDVGTVSELTEREPSLPVLSVKDFNIVDIRFLTFNTMLNNIIVPAVAIACVSSNCFPNALVAAPAITNTYIIEQCIVFATFGGSIRCFQSFPSVKSVSYNPPFSYSYQCGSTIAMTYSAVFVFMFIISGVIIPCGKLLLRYVLIHHAHSGSWLEQWAQTNLPSRFQHPRPESVGSPVLLFHKGKFAVRTVSYLATIVAFGSIFPPLAFVGCLSMVIITFVEQFIIGTFLLSADRARLSWFREELCRQCTGTAEYIHCSVRQIVPFSCIILGYLIFDTMGYTAGFLSALFCTMAFIIPPLILFPASARGVHAFIADRRRGSRIGGQPLKRAATPVDVFMYSFRKWCLRSSATPWRASAQVPTSSTFADRKAAGVTADSVAAEGLDAREAGTADEVQVEAQDDSSDGAVVEMRTMFNPMTTEAAAHDNEDGTGSIASE